MTPDDVTARLARLEESQELTSKFLHERLDGLDVRTERRLDRIEAAFAAGLAALQASIEKMINGKLQALDNRYAILRHLGLAALVALVTIAITMSCERVRGPLSAPPAEVIQR